MSLLKEENPSNTNLTETISKLKEEHQKMMYIISHDLQAPLRSIKSFSELLQKKNLSFDDKSKKYFDFIISSSNNLQNMIDSLLTLSRINTNPEASEKLSLNTILEELADLFTEEYKMNYIQMSFDSPNIIFNGIKQEINLALKEIIKNAIIYHHKDSKPKVTINVYLHDQKIEIHIEDKGLGIPSNKLTDIFDVFRKYEHSNTFINIPNTIGTGLTFSKKIIEKHGGSISAISQMNLGSKFIIDLPL